MAVPAQTKNGGQRKQKGSKVAKGSRAAAQSVGSQRTGNTTSRSISSGVGKTAMSKGVGGPKNNEASASGKAVSRVRTKGTTDKVASLSMKKNPQVKGTNAKNRTGLRGGTSASKAAGPGKGSSGKGK